MLCFILKSLSLITIRTCQKSDLPLFISPAQVQQGPNEVFPKPPLLQTEKAQIPQTFFIGGVRKLTTTEMYPVRKIILSQWQTNNSKLRIILRLPYFPHAKYHSPRKFSILLKENRYSSAFGYRNVYKTYELLRCQIRPTDL